MDQTFTDLGVDVGERVSALIELLPGSCTVITGGSVFQGQARVLRDAVVRIDGSRITDVAPGPVGPVPERCRSIDASGRWILPGMIDAHVHLTSRPTEAPRRALNAVQAGLELLCSSVALEKLLLDGVTTIRATVSEPADGAYAIERARLEGIIRAPRIVASGRPVTVRPRSARDAGASATIRDARRNLGEGAEVLTLHGSGRRAARALDARAMRWLVEEAHSRGVRTSMRPRSAQEALDAVSGGVDIVEGIPRGAGVKLMDEMARRGTFLMPLLSSQGEPSARHRSATKLAYESGVRLVAGTDARTDTMIGALARELRALRALDLPTHAVLQAATSHAAAALGLDGQVGAVEPGREAVLIIVNADNATLPIPDATQNSVQVISPSTTGLSTQG